MANQQRPVLSRGLIRRTERWYSSVDDSASGPLPPPASSAPFDPTTAGGLWGEQPYPERGNSVTWFQAHTEVDPPVVTRLWPIIRQGQTFTTPAFDALWESFGSNINARSRLLTSRDAALSANGTVNVVGTGVVDDDQAWRMFISPPLRGAQIISGSLRGVQATAEQAVANDYRAQVVAKVVDHAGSLRGVLYAGDLGALAQEFGTVSTVRRFPRTPAVVTPVSAQDGDRIVMEVGYRNHAGAVGNAQFIVSDHSNDDYPDDESVVAPVGAPWFEFTGIITFWPELTADWMYDAQPFVSNAPTWYQADLDSDSDGLTPPVVTPFDPATLDWGADATLDRSLTQRWFQTEIDGDVPSQAPNAPTHPDHGWDAGQDRSTGQRWIATEIEPTEGMYPPGAPPPFDPATMDWGYDAGMDRSIQPTWHAPDAHVLGDVPRANAPTHPDHGWDAQQDRSTAVRWYQEPDDATGIVPFNPTTATVAQMAGLWQDSSPQQDRSLQPRWYAPDAGQDLRLPLAPPPTVATVPEQAPLWLEQPGQERGNYPTWYSHGVEPVDGPLQSWLFTTGAPTPPLPRVLIDATTGQIHLYLGGNIIGPGS